MYALQFNELRERSYNMLELDSMSASEAFSNPPPGSRNVKTGRSIVGQGGKWIPCATKSGDRYFASVFKVGPGQRQACAVGMPFHSVDAAFSKAQELASNAAQ